MSRFGILGVVAPFMLFSLRAARYVRRTFRDGDIAYTRDPIQTWLLGKKLSARAVWETHAGNTWWGVRFIARRTRCRIVAITRGARDFWVKEGIPEERFLVAPDGFDPKEFADTPSKGSARAEFGLPLDARIVLYTGHLYDWKGATTLAQAAAFLPDDTTVVFVGGTSKDIAAFREQFGNDKHIRIIGHRPHREIPRWLSAADVLVLPNSGTSDMSRLYTSPLKLFEYMASGRAIVASDLPSIREILSDESALFVAPDDTQALARGIQAAFDDTENAARKAAKACADAAQYTWESRTKRILDFVSRGA